MNDPASLLACAPGTSGARRPTTVRAAPVLAVLALTVVAAACPAQADTRQAHVAVSASVLARAAIEQESVPASFVVSEADLARGYAEIPGATRLRVVNSSPLGYALDVWPVTAVFASADLTTGGTVATISQDGRTVMQRGLHSPSSILVLDVRFKLAAGVVPGRYPWPLRYQVRPLLRL